VDMSDLKELPADYNGYIYIYSHGIADTAKQIEPYKRAQIVYGPSVTFNYPDSIHYEDPVHKKGGSIDTIDTLDDLAALENEAYGLDLFEHNTIKKSLASWFYRIIRGRYKYSSLGQDYDIQHLKEVYDLVTALYPNAKIVLIGLSRGAATIDTMHYKYDGMKQVVAILTDSEFDTMDTVIQNKLIQTGLWRIFSLKRAQALVEKIFSLYKRNGISPIQAIEHVDLSVPRLIVVSKGDTLVPSICGITLYKKLRAMGHEKVHLCILDRGAHGKVITGPDRANYQYITHAFYKHYGLPYDSVLAEQGEFLFSTSQPDLS
jgi:hypothetical protein